MCICCFPLECNESDLGFTAAQDGMVDSKCAERRYVRSSHFSDGVVCYNGTTAMSEAIYICDDNFNLMGEATRVCQSDGNWNGRTPQCIQGIVIYLTEYTPNLFAIVQCDKYQEGTAIFPYTKTD